MFIFTEVPIVFTHFICWVIYIHWYRTGELFGIEVWWKRIAMHIPIVFAFALSAGGMFGIVAHVDFISLPDGLMIAYDSPFTKLRP